MMHSVSGDPGVLLVALTGPVDSAAHHHLVCILLGKHRHAADDDLKRCRAPVSGRCASSFRRFRVTRVWTRPSVSSSRPVTRRGSASYVPPA